MWVSEERELLYIRVPKTGSESFVNALKLKWLGSKGHQTVWDAMQTNPMFYYYHHLKFKKIGFIRHPLPWLDSFFGWSMRGYQWRDYVYGPPYEKGKGGDQFLFNLTVTPLSWLTHPETGELLVDEVYRTEDLPKIADEMNITIKHLNPTTEGRFKKQLDWHDYRLAYVDKRFARELEYYK